MITAAAGVALINVDQGYRSAVVRDGTLDPTFGDNGITSTEFFNKQSSYEAVHDVAIDEFGRMLAVGDGGYLVRYASDGSVDTTFGSDGYAHFPGSAVDVAVTADRRIVVAGSSFDGATSRFVVARYLPSGTLDETFGDAGVRTTSFADYRVVASAVEIAPDGRIVVAGTGRNASNTDFDFVAARYLADGSLDTSFDGDGRVSTSIGTFDFANDVAFQLDGSIVVVGSARIGAQDDVAIVHYLPTGSLNTSFGTAGIRTTDFGSSADDEARSVVVEPSGRFTIAGRTKVGNQFDIALARYISGGILDTSFDTDGLVTTDFTGDDDAGQSIAIQANGSIVVTGEAGLPSGFTDVAVLRYTSAGLLDSTFDTDGKLTTDFGGESDFGNRVVINASGKIVIVGTATLTNTYYDFALLRYNTDGSLDTSFDTDGKVSTAIRTSTDEAASVAVLANGSFVLAGSAQNVNKDFALSRYSAFGQLDSDFGTNGKVTTSIDSGDDLVRRVIETPTGKLLAVGRTQSGSNWNVALAQYHADGSLDTTFGTGGIVVTDFGSADDDAVDVAIDALGNIFVAGHRSGANGMDIVVARYDVNGTLNTTFGTNGFVTTSLGASDETAAKLAIQNDGKLVLVGYTTANSNADMLVARYNSDWTLDTAFDSDGIAFIDFGSDDYAQSVTVSYNGKITVAGASGTGNALDFALARLTPSGSVDTSFGVGGKVTTDFSGNVDVIRDIATAEDGKLVATGFTHNGTNIDFALARYTANGVLDTSFATGGKSSTGIGPSDDYAHAIGFDSGGDILVAGSAHVGASTDFAVARYTNTSSVDVAIDQHGNLIVNDRDAGGAREIRFDATSIIVTDPTGTLTTAIEEAVVINPHTLAIPLSIVSGSVLYRGGDGQQSLTLDLSTGPISRPISVTDTVDNFSGSISLELIGDVNAANVVHSVNGPLSGSIAITGNSLITYEATQTVHQLLSAQDVAVNFPDITNSQTLTNDGLGRIQLLGSQSPEIHLVAPSQSLSVHLGGGVQNTLEIVELTLAASTSLFIDGNSIDDEIIVSGPVSLAGGDFSLSADTIDVLTPVSTSGGDVVWTSTGHIRLGDSLTTAGGHVSITADSDADGSGLFQIQPTIATTFANPQLVKPNDPAAGDWFGSAVAVSGDTAFIAADGDEDHGNDSGSVYVFTKTAGVWTQTQKITPTDGAALEYFGYPLAMSRDTVVFSAQRQDVAGVVDAGAAYVYRKIAGTWTFEQKLTASDADAQDWFAHRVAIQGDTIVATAPQDSEAASLAGAVYVFTRTGNVWTQTQKLTASDASASLQLGDSLAIDDGTIIVGAFKDTHSGTLSGSAYVFTEDNGVWTQSQKLTAFVPTSFDDFGYSVAIDGDSLLVGARSHDADGVVNTGAAFAFARENGVWKPQAKLVHEGALESNHLGIAVSLVGDTAVVGSLGGGGISNAYGAAFTFVRRGDTWYQQSKFTTGEASDFYSFAVAHDASTAVVGAYLASSPLSDAGSAYFYESVASSDIGGSINVGSGNLSITSATIELLGSVTGTGTLLMQPSQPGASIGLGGAAGKFNIDDFELSQISDGFSHITIGYETAGTGTVSVSSSTFNDPITIAGGTLHVDDSGGVTAPVVTLSGEISPENSPGVLNVDGDTVITSGSSVIIEFAGIGGPGSIEGHDQISSTGRVDIEPSVALTLVGLGNHGGAERLIIVERTGGIGTFADVPEGHVVADLLGTTQDFRITYAGGDGDDIELIGDVDYGDAPTSYGTLAINDGARHADTGPRLGALRDSESDAFASVGADGDNTNGIDDEDGVLFGQILTTATMAALNIDLQNASTAKVDVWIDFDRDGIWSASEKILDSATVDQATQTLNFSLPAGLTAGTAIARVRLSTAGGLSATGFAMDGEVEDYAVAIVSQSAPTDITLSNHSINENVDTSAADLLFANLSAIDEDPGDSHTFGLVSGTGDSDNSKFVIDGNSLKLRQGETLNYETQSSYAVRIRTTDSGGLSVEKEVLLQVNNLIEISKSDITINAGSAQRSRVDSVTIEFDTDMILQEGAITVHNGGAGGGAAGTILSPIVGVASRTFTLSFSGAFTEFGSLADGNYELRIDATKIISVDGFGLDTNQDGVTGDNFVFGDEANDKFFRYYGDADGDRDVDGSDFLFFRGTYGKSQGQTGYNSIFDFNLNNSVDGSDYLQFRGRYSKPFLF